MKTRFVSNGIVPFNDYVDHVDISGRSSAMVYLVSCVLC